MNNLITISTLSSKFEKTRLVIYIKEKYGIKQENLGKVMMILFMATTATSQGSQCCSFLIGTLYPLYVSCKLLKSQENLTEEKDLHKYWIVWITFTRIELALNAIITLIPFFAQIKLALYLTNVYNSFQISTHLFNNVIVPLYESCDNKINEIQWILESKKDKGED